MKSSGDQMRPDLPRDLAAIASNLIIYPAGRSRFYSLLDTTGFDAYLVQPHVRLEEIIDED